ncbi:AMP-binding protein [Hoeflea prorocentri]|uniref:AMP-binding protein n=1 Tax=Hoeflea prorocentri TaxID=1922333 RepID=A0A9X3UMY3_9HYPH|nr:AMP-binding protein [Hoeflea prorocentri]MCY6383663.1 AMP-binding protein [Hoeflea prorocentri]MDA5401463.1 AMP-binding protein [Hoeflea prorocentri]
MLPVRQSYEALVRDFAWAIPDRYNIARSVCDDWAEREPDRVCLLHYMPDGEPDQLTYGDLRERSNALAAGLAALGVGREDRVALLLPQGFDTAIAHVAIYKLGAIAVPLALLFGIEALDYRLRTSGVKCVITNEAGSEKVRQIAGGLDGFAGIVSTDEVTGTISFQELISSHPGRFETADTGAEDPALMIFTSGTTGPPKGALHAHRVLLGHLPGVQLPHEFLPQEDDLFWTPADWAWAGGLLNVLLPGLHFGVPVVSSAAQKFDPETAFRIMEKTGVRNAFIPPTALKMLRTVERPSERFDLKLRTIGSGGESLGKETYEWARQELGLTINEFYGQTECNLVVSSCGKIGVSRAGAIGRAVPGHTVAIIDRDGQEVSPGTPGQIAVKRPDPVMFLRYWDNEPATRSKFIGDWMLTGDQGIMSEDGYIEFFGRDDDVITSAGYRIGPGEIEDCLTGHPAVALAAAVGKPDALRTEIVKAYIVLAPGHKPSHALAGEIQDWVKVRLSAHEYPREVEFLKSMPLTTTGKVIRRELRDRAIREAGV